MIRPAPLKPGDTIGIAATARKISEEEVQFAVDVFRAAGLRVVFSPTLFAAEDQFGGNDLQRAAGLQNLLDDPQVKAIIIARGGYGTVRIIDQLRWDSFLNHPKWLIGFSDVTVLHAHIHSHCNIETLHAPMCLNFQPERFHQPSIEALLAMLMSDHEITYQTAPHVLNRLGDANGILTGGNLSVLYSILGSPSDIYTKGKILFLEDLDEYLYHIDRMMMNLKRNGKLDGLAGLVIGDMSDMKDNSIPFGKQAIEIIAAHVADYNFPVAFGFPAGHEKRNLALRMGARVQLSVTTNGVTLIN